MSPAAMPARASVRPDALLLMVWREGLAAKRSPSGLAKDLRSVGRAHALRDADLLGFFFEAVLGTRPASQLASQITTHAPVLHQLLSGSADTPEARLALLACAEQLLTGGFDGGPTAASAPAPAPLLKKAPHVFKALYETDLLSEELILAWHARPVVYEPGISESLILTLSQPSPSPSPSHCPEPAVD